MNILDLLSPDVPEGRAGIVTFLNHHSYLVHKRSGTRLDAFDFVHVDGIAMVWLLRVFGIKTCRRSFDYSSIADPVFRSIEASGRSIFIAGAQANQGTAFVQALRGRYPELVISGFESGHFDGPDHRRRCIDGIVNLRPDVLLVGMGAPLQENFILDTIGAGWSGTAYTCGGFIHQTATTGGTYYPPIFDRLHLRWLYRLIDEPKLWRRYLVQYPVATLHLAIEAAKRRTSIAVKGA